MRTIRFSLKMLKASYKKALFYGVAIICSSAIIFALLNIVFSDIYLVSEYNPLGMEFVLLIITMAILATFYANSFFLQDKAKEIAIITLSGVTVDRMAIILFIQNFVIIVTSLLIGFGIGVPLAFGLNKLCYDYIGVTGNIYAIHEMTLYATALFVGIEVIYLVLLNTGFAYRTEIIDLIKTSQKIFNPGKRTKKKIKLSAVLGDTMAASTAYGTGTPVKKIDFTEMIDSVSEVEVEENEILGGNKIYILAYLLPFAVFILFRGDGLRTAVIIGTYLGVFGVQGIIRYFLPQYLTMKKDKHKTNGVDLMTYGNLHYASRSSSLLILLITVSVMTITNAISIYSNDKKVGFVAIVSYFIILVLLAICIIYKVITEAIRRVKNFRQVQLQGFNKKQIVKMIKKEMIAFFSMLIFLPLPYIIALVFTNVNLGYLNMVLGSWLVLFYVVAFGIAGIISYLSYRHFVIETIKPGFGK